MTIRPLSWRGCMPVVHRLLSSYVLDPATDCWLWTKSTSQGYGQIVVNGRRGQRAHVVSFQIHKGRTAKGLVIRHTCDNKRCINPDHLIAGDQIQNMTDMVERGRSARGERHGMVKLTEQQVIEIRKSSENQYRLAARLGVSRTTISDIRRRRSWAHLGSH